MLDGGWKRKERGEVESLRILTSGRDVGSVLGICDKALVEGCRRQESVCTLNGGR
jgi:hypothetical protein